MVLLFFGGFTRWVFRSFHIFFLVLIRFFEKVFGFLMGFNVFFVFLRFSTVSSAFVGSQNPPKALSPPLSNRLRAPRTDCGASAAVGLGFWAAWAGDEERSGRLSEGCETKGFLVGGPKNGFGDFFGEGKKVDSWFFKCGKCFWLGGSSKVGKENLKWRNSALLRVGKQTHKPWKQQRHYKGT